MDTCPAPGLYCWRGFWWHWDMCSYWSSRRGVCFGISPNGGTSANTFALHLDENYWVLRKTCGPWKNSHQRKSFKHMVMNLLHCGFLDGFQGETLHLSGVLSFKVWRQRVWMRQYGSSSLKPTNLWCNSEHVKDLSLGKLTQDRVGQLTNMFRPTTTPKNLQFF